MSQPSNVAAARPILPRQLAMLSGPLLGLLVVLAIFITLIGAKGNLSSFLSLRNLQVVAHEATIPGVVALGALLVIITGGIDLSVGSVVALVTVVMMRVFTHVARGTESLAFASAVAIGSGILVGGLCGLINGLVITRLKLPPFVATLGMYSIARGVAVWVAERQLLSFPRDSRPGWVDHLARVHADFLFFNPGFWLLLIVSFGVVILLHRTVLGRYIYALGSSEPTARLCGIPVDRVKLATYTLAGLLAGLGGVLLFAHGAAGDPSGAETLELRVIAAVVIGGASLTGGRGTVIGTLLGVLILEVLSNGVNTFNVPIEAQHILIGVIILLNTALSQWRARAQR